MYVDPRMYTVLKELTEDVIRSKLSIKEGGMSSGLTVFKVQA